MDLVLPPQLPVARSSIRFMDNTGISVGTFTGLVRSAGLGGDRLGASVEFPLMGGKTPASIANRAAIMAFIARTRGRQNRVYIPDSSYSRRGAIATSELIANNTFLNALTGWTASGSGITLKSSQRILRSVRATVVGTETVRAASVSAPSDNAAYAFRVMVNSGKGAVAFRLRIGSSAGGSEYTADGADRTSDQLATLAFGITGGTTSTFYPSIQDLSTGKSAGDFMEMAYSSFSRCALVNGASQTGSALLLKYLPISTDDLLVAGDQFEVLTTSNGVLGSEWKIVTASLHSDASGFGYLRFEPALRGSVADSAPVILNNPMGRFVLRSGNPEWSNDPGVFTRSSLEFDEAA